MNMQEMKKLLKDQLALEIELIELIEELMTEVFPEHHKEAILSFKDNLEHMDDWGCIQSLRCLKDNLVIDGKYPYRKEEKE